MRWRVEAIEDARFGRVVAMYLMVPHGDHEDEMLPLLLAPDYARQLATELFDEAEAADPSAPLTIEHPENGLTLHYYDESHRWPPDLSDYIKSVDNYDFTPFKFSIGTALPAAKPPRPLRVYRTPEGLWTYSCTEHPEDTHGRGLWHDQPTASTQATAHLLRSH